jgi:cell division protein FtsW
MKFKLKEIDHIFEITVIALTVYGLIMVFSASAPSALYNHKDSMYFFKRQAIWAVVGIFTMFIVSAIDYRTIKKYANPLYIISLISLVAVLVVGMTINGSKRWINLGFTTIQPSEIVKITIVIMCAIVLSKLDEISVKKSWQPLIACGVIIGLGAILLILQPHFSAIIIIALAVGVMMLAAGVPFRIFSPIGLLALIGGGAVAIIEPYRWERIVSFLDPFKYKMGSGWQAVQSLYAIGSGGLSGLGMGRSRQKFMYIPEAQNDFIFAIICEELGFIGALGLMILFAILLWRATKIALKAPDRFSMLMTFGLISLTMVQFLLNIGVATSSIPPTGISLPFFSAGGTSFIFQMIGMGIILNISTNPKGMRNDE